MKYYIAWILFLSSSFMNVQAQSQVENSSLNSQPGCSESFENFCKELYSPKNQGNMDLKVGNQIMPLRFGLGANGLSESFVGFERTKIKNQNHLPVAFLTKLRSRHYFEKLKKFLVLQGDRTKIRRLGSELGSLWQDSFREILEEEMEAKYPGFIAKTYEDRSSLYFPDGLLKTGHSMSGNNRPLIWKIEYDRLYNQRMSSIYQGIWSEDPEWKSIEKKFNDLKSAYIEMIESDERFSKIPEKVKTIWIERIKEEEILAPGSDSDAPDPACGSTDENAYHRNKGGVSYCGGFISALPSTMILAHELGHALGEKRSEVLFEENSELKKRIRILIGQLSSSGSTKSCPAEWSKIKTDFSKLLTEFEGYMPLRPEYLNCLQTREIKGHPSVEYIKQRAVSHARESVSKMATYGFFLQISKPTIFTNDGLEWANPTYLNSTNFSDWDSNAYTLKNDHTIHFFFESEYACSDSALSASERMEHSIKTAQEMFVALLEKMIPLGGKFSSDHEMTSRDYSEDTDERFADSMANEVVAHQLLKIADRNDRRNIFFAEHSSSCSPISLRERYSEEDTIQNKFSLEPHPSGKQRRYDFLTRPIRDALGCRLDFEPKDCSP